MSPVTCISGIDTDIGKSVATGLMARALLSFGHTVITQKVVQTGCQGIAEDIRVHRELMGVDLFAEDRDGLTCPYVFAKPCSPHLAAELEGKTIDPETITGATKLLAQRYEHVLLEGAGGLMVPLTAELTFLDYIEKQKYPLILVSSPRLGSINHTLSALELLQHRHIVVKGIVYNCYGESDPEIRADSRQLFVKYLQKYGFSGPVRDFESAGNYGEPRQQFACEEFFNEYSRGRV